MAFDEKRDGDIEKEGGLSDVSILDEGAEMVQAQQPLSIKDEEVATGRKGEEKKGNGLPFSKARCIALVATVTGAAFLNVRILCSQARRTWDRRASEYYKD
jgi:hypothetical protein